MVILKFSKPRKQVVLSVNVSELGDVFLLTIWIVKAYFAGRWCF